ncbi:hypothetical protein GE300_16670 [Rhodobacteraceae bacterium 2CG4]|uniref:ChsH2 rubredoxin-like zinc ribbon domain-containing protein n=1 Tax=Halovulum marinum TaxID=2662447 RepID=A0A6L5Z3U5_9RHOB|nr:zinc ribbon domain-containing protein [Halovulum marinum]MSU91218.1 hypothetical protein [Halovulum marinum]
MKRRLCLDYTLPTGRLRPHFEALAQGRALAARCADCARVAFPPALTCAACGGSGIDWVPLAGSAKVLHRTDTPGAAFALAAFDGAAGAALVRLADAAAAGRRGQLVPPKDNDAGLWLALEEAEDDDDSTG